MLRYNLAGKWQEHTPATVHPVSWLADQVLVVLSQIKAAERVDGVPVYPEAQPLATGVQVEPAGVLAQAVEKTVENT